MQGCFKILFLGDIVGRPARKFLQARLSRIKEVNDIDLVIANGENATGGAGINMRSIKDIQNAGVDIITLGDHVLDRDFVSESQNKVDLSTICVPCNTELAIAGTQFVNIQKNNVSIGVCIMLGRQFMKISAMCPFKKFDEIFKKYRSVVDIFVTEIHAEATSEKIAYGWYVDGKADAVIGTHTHVQTADERILPGGSAYITDLGMCGAHKSVIGREIDSVIDVFVSGRKQRLGIAEEDLRLNGCILEFNLISKQVVKFVRFSHKD